MVSLPNLFESLVVCAKPKLAAKEEWINVTIGRALRQSYFNATLSVPISLDLSRKCIPGTLQNCFELARYWRTGEDRHLPHLSQVRTRSEEQFPCILRIPRVKLEHIAWDFMA